MTMRHTIGVVVALARWLFAAESLPEPPTRSAAHTHAPKGDTLLHWLVAAEKLPPPPTQQPPDRARQVSVLSWLLARETLPQREPSTPKAQEKKDAAR